MTGSTSCGQAPSFWRLCAVTFSKPLHETEASPIIQIFFINVLFTVPVIQINYFKRIKANRFIKYRPASKQKYFLKELFKRSLEQNTVSAKVWGPLYFECLIYSYTYTYIITYCTKYGWSCEGIYLGGKIGIYFNTHCTKFSTELCLICSKLSHCNFNWRFFNYVFG